jgi:hypothetical protein
MKGPSLRSILHQWRALKVCHFQKRALFAASQENGARRARKVGGAERWEWQKTRPFMAHSKRSLLIQSSKSAPAGSEGTHSPQNVDVFLI